MHYFALHFYIFVTVHKDNKKALIVFFISGFQDFFPKKNSEFVTLDKFLRYKTTINQIDNEKENKYDQIKLKF